jgi:NAD(P)-dependent dehydrogenase (short-subunit alcohol dehydrogenase family)
MSIGLNPFSLVGKKFLVTGAASGIGRATSVVLSNLGADLIMLDMNSDGLHTTLSACRTTDKVLEFDLTNTSMLRTEIERIVFDFGKLNGFVHCAGRPYISPLKTISEKKSFEIFSINTYSAIELAKTISNRNIYCGDKGAIVLVSSVYALVGSAANVGYAMSKSALHGITKSLAIELADKAIRVNCVAPGFVETKMMSATNSSFAVDHNDHIAKLHPLGLGQPEDIACSIAFLLSDAAKWITGSILNVDGGFTAQ